MVSDAGIYCALIQYAPLAATVFGNMFKIYPVFFCFFENQTLK